jgi:hypothetical protein
MRRRNFILATVTLSLVLVQTASLGLGGDTWLYTRHLLFSLRSWRRYRLGILLGCAAPLRICVAFACTYDSGRRIDGLYGYFAS